VPERIQLRRTKGWRLPDGAIVVSRPSRFGNPFKVGERLWPGSPLWPYLTQSMPGGTAGSKMITPVDRAIVVEAHRLWLTSQPHLMAAVREQLGGRDLACWCPLPHPGQVDVCHAATLLAIAGSGE
jgi:hypothetical protein